MIKKNVTLKDIAENIGVSQRTVSLAIQGEGRMSESTRKKILHVAREWNYRPNIMARGLVTKKTYLLGVVLPYVTTSFYSHVLAGIEEKSGKGFYDLLLRNSGNDLATEENAVERMLNRQVDGIICYPNQMAYDLYKKVIDSGTPLVQVGRVVPLLNTPSVTVDDEKGLFQAVEKLILTGCKKIIYLCAGSGTSLMNNRREGYRKALKKYGISLDLQQYEIKCNHLSYNESYSKIKHALSQGLEVDGIASCSDNIAIGAVKACIELGKKIPEEVSIIGYDDVELSHIQSQYALTTMSQPKREIGYAAFDIFMKLMHHEKVNSIVLESKLIERDTTF